jgi:ATP-binding cassette subfamily B protein
VIKREGADRGETGRVAEASDESLGATLSMNKVRISYLLGSNAIFRIGLAITCLVGGGSRTEGIT